MAPLDPDELAEQARDYAWEWFALHAGQRMQTFNFFLVAMAFILAAYGTLLDRHRIAAAGVALVGAWLAVWFNRLDRRTRQLIKASEVALTSTEQRLATATGVPELALVSKVEAPDDGTSSYRSVIAVIQWTMLVVFLLCATYAVWLLMSAPLPFDSRSVAPRACP